MEILMLLFTTPVQHRNTERALMLAKSFVEAGDKVHVFLLGDGVYNGSSALISGEPAEAAAQLLSLPSVTVTACITCVKARRISLSPGVSAGGLDDLSEQLERCDTAISLTSEA